jgi:hypothetical protein
MSKKMASIIVVYGVALAAISILIQKIAPGFGKVILITGITGGGLSVLWGIVALAGSERRAWAVLTMIAITFVTLSQTVQAWMPSGGPATTSLTGRLVLTLMLLMTAGMLMYLLHGERPPEFYDRGTTRRDKSPSRGDDAHSNDGRHQSK